MRKLRRFLVPAVFFGLTACAGEDIQDNPEKEDPGEVTECTTISGEAPSGIYSSASQFERDLCSPGSLKDVDLDGLWTMVEEGGFAARPLKIEQDCESGLKARLGGMTTSTEMQYTELSEDDLFLYAREDNQGFSFTNAVSICGRNESGNLIGRAADCFEGMFDGEDYSSCTLRKVEIVPFGRMQGEDEMSGLSLVSEYSGPAENPWPDVFTANVAVRGDFAYVARSEDGLRIVDVSDPEAPTEVGHFVGGFDAYNDVQMVDDGEKLYALLAGNYNGMAIVEVTDPSSPKSVDVINPFSGDFSGVHRLYVETVGEQVRAYLADGASAEVFIMNVTDPENVSTLGSYQLPNPEWGVHAVHSDDGRMYVNATVGGMLVVDSKEFPGSPTQVGHFAGATYSHTSWTTVVGDKPIVVHNDEGYGAHARILDADEESPQFMQEIGSYETRPEVSVHNLVIEGKYAYLAYYQDGVRVLDLSNPTAPAEAAHFNTWDPETAPGSSLEGAVDLEVDSEAGLVYVADTPRGLLILESSF